MSALSRAFFLLLFLGLFAGGVAAAQRISRSLDLDEKLTASEVPRLSPVAATRCAHDGERRPALLLELDQRVSSR